MVVKVRLQRVSKSNVFKAGPRLILIARCLLVGKLGLVARCDALQHTKALVREGLDWVLKAGEFLQMAIAVPILEVLCAAQ